MRRLFMADMFQMVNLDAKFAGKLVLFEFISMKVIQFLPNGYI